MYQLYYYPAWASTFPHLVLKALNVPFELVKVDIENKEHKSDSYRKLNPAGRIPTLVNGDFALFESPAIAYYLCEQHPQSNLLPEQHEEKASVYQWVNYLNSTVQAEMDIFYYPNNHSIAAADSDNIVAKQTQRIADMFELLDQQLTNKRFFVGNQLTLVDLLLFMLAQWAQEARLTPLPLQRPNLGPYLKRLAQLPVIQEVYNFEDIDIREFTE